VVHVTGNFQSESPLSPRVQQALAEAISQGWADPRKLSQASSRARILHDQCRESLANGLGVLPQELEILGEPNLSPYWATAGLLEDNSTLYFSTIDRKEIHALARSHPRNQEMPVDAHGLIQVPPLNPDSVICLQGANGETGIAQDVEALIASAGKSRISWDLSTAAPYLALPPRWDVAFFDPKFWQGPQGLGLVAISENARWKNPLPHLGALRTPHSSSLPLLICAAVALEEWQENRDHESQRIRQLTQEFRASIAQRVEDCDIAGGPLLANNSLPHITSLSFLYVEGEELLRRLEKRGLSVDSGSACTAEDLQPSHVLSAMGVLTHGNVRATFHSGTTRTQMLALADAICENVMELRAP
jgi:cysteine desulfurase